MLHDDTRLRVRKIGAQLLYRSKLLFLLERQKRHPWTILMYHRVVNPDEVPYPLQPGMYVTPETFREHLQFLKDHATVIPLDELITRVKEDRPMPRRAVAITFDDGWADNFTHAYPLLKEFNLPATIFLATAYIDTANWFWTDELPYAISCLRRAPNHLQSAAGVISSSEKVDSTLRLPLTTLLMRTPESKLPEALDDLITSLKQVALPTRAAAVKKMLNLAKEFCTLTPKRAFLNWKEVEEMSRNNISFGSHTHTHQRLTDLTPEQIRDELHNSYQLLRSHQVLFTPVFCYPEGAYDDTTQMLLAEKGVRTALSIERGMRLDRTPSLFPRTGIHQDIAADAAMLGFRIWGEELFINS